MATRRRSTRIGGEAVEFRNVTRFRNTLLGAIEEFQKSPAKRFVITKHGTPEAVLMSYKTYSVLSEMMNEDFRRTSGQTRDEAISAAFDRLRHDQKSATPVPQVPEVKVEIDPVPASTLEEVTVVRADQVSGILRGLRQQMDELDQALKERTTIGADSPLVSDKE